MPAAQLPRVEVLQHLWKLFALKRKWKNLSRPVTHARHPPVRLARPRPSPAGGGARACDIVLSPSQLLNRDGIMSSI
jgi:hypothetical protein